jgi:ferredoxin
MCALTAPRMFDQDPGDGRVLLLSADPEADEDDMAAKAVTLCPSGALSRHEA